MRLVPLAMPSLGTPAPSGAAAAPDRDAHPSEECCKTQLSSSQCMQQHVHQKKTRHSKPLLEQGLRQDRVCPCVDGVVIQVATGAGWACSRQQSVQTPAWAPMALPHRGTFHFQHFFVCSLQRAAVGSRWLQGGSGRK